MLPLAGLHVRAVLKHQKEREQWRKKNLEERRPLFYISEVSSSSNQGNYISIKHMLTEDAIGQQKQDANCISSVSHWQLLAQCLLDFQGITRQG